MKVFLITAWAAVALAIGAGVLVWTVSGTDASCDDEQLIAAMQSAIGEAKRPGATQVAVSMPAACTDGDLVAALPAVSRTWHVMPGGSLMREPAHTGP